LWFYSWLCWPCSWCGRTPACPSPTRSSPPWARPRDPFLTSDFRPSLFAKASFSLEVQIAITIRNQPKNIVCIFKKIKIIPLNVILIYTLEDFSGIISKKLAKRFFVGTAGRLNPFGFVENLLKNVIITCNFTQENFKECLESVASARKLIHPFLRRRVHSHLKETRDLGFVDNIEYENLLKFVRGKCKSLMSIKCEASVQPAKVKTAQIVQHLLKTMELDELEDKLLQVLAKYYLHIIKSREENIFFAKYVVPDFEALLDMYCTPMISPRPLCPFLSLLLSALRLCVYVLCVPGIESVDVYLVSCVHYMAQSAGSRLFVYNRI
jgi:hypothetical protein